MLASTQTETVETVVSEEELALLAAEEQDANTVKIGELQNELQDVRR